jgi:hypothetical protein
MTKITAIKNLWTAATGRSAVSAK